MIASVTQLSSSNASQRASADEVARQKLEAQERSATPSAAETPAPRSAVVQISAEAASQSQTQAQAQQAPTRTTQPQAAPQTVRLAPAAAQSEDGASSSVTTDLRYYDPADADKNGQISEFEQQAYDYRHPPSLAQQQLAQQQQQQQQQLRAYAEVARSGQAGPQT